MFREVRKKKNAISIEEAQEVLTNARYGIMSVTGDDGYAYGMPLNFYYDKEANRIFFHTLATGYKVSAIKANDKVCFTAVGPEVAKDPEEPWAPYVKSAVVFGRCHLIEDREEVINRVRQFALKYYPDADLVEEVIAEDGKAVSICEIEIEHMTGKEVQER